MKHTPGPWHWGWDDSSCQDQLVNREICRQILEPHDLNCRSTMWGENLESDKRLIAAAPELLEALKKLVSVCRIDSDIRAATSGHLSLAEDAIAKAEGKP